MTETQLNGQTYRIGRLNAFQQLHVSRKIGPLVPRLIPAYLALREGGANQEVDVLASLLGPFTEALAALPDEVVDYVVMTCLSAVHRQQGSTWAPVWNQHAGALMFDDIDLGTMLPITTRVITENLGPFIRGLLTGQLPPKANPTQ